MRACLLIPVRASKRRLRNVHVHHFELDHVRQAHKSHTHTDTTSALPLVPRVLQHNVLRGAHKRGVSCRHSCFLIYAKIPHCVRTRVAAPASVHLCASNRAIPKERKCRRCFVVFRQTPKAMKIELNISRLQMISTSVSCIV